MSLGDMFQPEKDVMLKISIFEELVRKSERADILEKAIYAGLHRETIIQLIAGKPPELEEYEKTGMSPDEIRKTCIQLEEAKTSIGFHEEREKSLQTALDKLQEDYEQLGKIADDLQKELEDQKQKAAEKPAEKPKKTNGGANKKKLDIGKIRALREAGWSFQKIGEEMGCSPQTIANALQREGSS